MAGIASVMTYCSEMVTIASGYEMVMATSDYEMFAQRVARGRKKYCHHFCLKKKKSVYFCDF